MKSLKIVSTVKAPAAIGPYSQAVACNGFVYVSGQLPLKPETGIMVEANIVEQTAQVLENMKAILEEAGASFNSVLKTTVYLKSMEDFVKMNEVYAKYFFEHKPARAAFEVARLPKDALVEIECVAACNAQ